MNRRIFTLDSGTVRNMALNCVKTAPDGFFVTVAPPSRTLEQNALLWPLLQSVSRKVDWYGQKLTDEEWKDVFSAALKKQKAVPGLDGGFVICGQSTSKMSKKEFSDLIELIYAFCAERGVQVE